MPEVCAGARKKVMLTENAEKLRADLKMVRLLVGSDVLARQLDRDK